MSEKGVLAVFQDTGLLPEATRREEHRSPSVLYKSLPHPRLDTELSESSIGSTPGSYREPGVVSKSNPPMAP